MSERKTIVIALDASPRASAVLDAGRLMAERLDARVVFVSAVEGFEFSAPPELMIWQDPKIWTEVEDDFKARQARAAEQLPKDSVLARRVAHGQPWRLICDTAKEYGAALVVVGAHAYRASERFLGTTASKVANRADTSVLVVRQPEGLSALGFERIVVAHDGSERAPAVVASALRLATRGSGIVSLVRAVSFASPLPPSVGSGGTATLEETLVRLGLDELNAVRAKLPEDARVDVDAQVGMPWDVVSEVARARRANLIVIGSHGFSGLDRVLGTSAGRIVNLADRSVLIVRNAGVQ